MVKRNNFVLGFIFVSLVFIMVFVLAVGIDDVTHVSPANNSWTSGTNETETFSFNYTGVNESASCVLSINDTAVGTNATSPNGTTIILSSNVSFGEGAFNWSVNCTNGSYTASSSNWTLNVDTTFPQIDTAYPTNTSYAIAPTNFNFTYTEDNCNKTWYSNDSGVTNSSAQACTSNFTGMVTVEGSNNWTVYMNDTAGNENSSIIYFTVDTTFPQISTAYPTNISYATPPTQFNFTYTEANNHSVWYSNDSGVNNYSIQANTSNFTNMETVEGSNNWTVYMNDTAGNENSSIIYFTVDTTFPVASAACSPSSVNTGATVTCTCSGTDSGSGINSSLTTAGATPSTASVGTFSYTCSVTDNVGNSHSASASYVVTSSSSGGGGAPTYSASEADLLNGYSVSLGRHFRARFNLEGQSHYLKVDSISGNKITVTISSDPVTLDIIVGQTEKVDVDADGDYDLSIYLEAISSNKANLVLTLIDEIMAEEVVDDAEEVVDEEVVSEEAEDIVEDDGIDWNLWIALIVILVIVVVLVGKGIKKRKKRK